MSSTPLSFSADADNKGWIKDKLVPAVKQVLPVVNTVLGAGCQLTGNPIVCGASKVTGVVSQVIGK